MVFLFKNKYEKPHFDQGYNSGYDLVFGSIRGLHCMWLLPCTRASSDVLVWCLADIDYQMPELGSDDLVMGSGLCPWSPTVALHVILNSGVEAELMCLDSLRLPNCSRTTHIGSSISVLKVTKGNVFL
ncbi:hypothetical protein M9H77_13166 [Catharanthus roseus]|uniref:Uncharacterized protein n=1 Tax=Catharanthus roseus TaxID=4058 RepID=A0ACC0BJF2_CATRO|nr:hypothetical protein M9H77_13166 [Catharanthus roseus]